MSDSPAPLVQPTTDYALNETKPAPEIQAAPETAKLASPIPTLEPQGTRDEVQGTGKKDYALITGASSGIGQAFAQVLAAKKKPLILIGRREPQLKTLADELRQREGIDVRFLPIDLARSKELPLLPGKLKAMGFQIDVLVNCAGFGKYGNEEQVSYEDSLNMVNLNCRAVLALTKLFLPEMLRRKKGAIINVADMVGFFPVPNMATYAATKAFVISFTEALAQELKGTGVRIICSCPSPVASAFHARSNINPAKFKNLNPLSDPQTVAEQTLQALKDGETLVLTGKPTIWTRLMPKILPRSWLSSYGSALLHPQA